MSESLFPIPRRIELRQAVTLARMRNVMVVLSPDEVDELLDAFEHGQFSTRERLVNHSEGDPVVVRPSDPLAGSQAGLNGPSGSPTSPSDPAHRLRGYDAVSESLERLERYRDWWFERAVAIERENAELRGALAAYRSALRSGEPETEQLRALGDAALADQNGDKRP